MSEPKKFLKHPLFWVPTLYLAMGIPFNVINSTASSMYKSLGVSDGQNTVALGSVIIAWSLKPLWAAFLDMYRTKKFFVVLMELLMPLLFIGVAMSLPLPGYFQISIAMLWVASFASSTQDICGDGIYLTAIDKKTQANLAGVQGMFWNLGKVLATGVLISGMESLSTHQGWSTQKMWSGVWVVVAITMVLFAVYHYFVLPTGSIAHRPQSTKQVMEDFLGSATTFFHKRAFWGMIAFVFLYRLGEGLIMVEGKLFLQSSTESGGLGLTAGQVANIDAVYGTVAAIAGGILGGMFLGKLGLKKALPILGLCLNIPHFTFVYLSHYGAAGHGLDYSIVVTMVSIEKFGYGFGFIGNMVYMMQQFAPGRCTMTHYAFATALMNFVLAPTTMISGPLAEWLGFSTFFVVVMFASVPSVWAAYKAPFPLDGDTEKTKTEPSGIVITPDDPSRLTDAEQTVQRSAGRASTYAMLNILMLLLADAKILGSLQGKPEGAGQIQFGFLLASAALKIYLTMLTLKHAKIAAAQAQPIGETSYLGNARGAKVATIICALVTVAVLTFGYRQAF
ncbi:MAG: MFS transporter [Verrucomicrobia bacterium]|nr:MFS transporter [Verrucomicrobiota bacterium]